MSNFSQGADNPKDPMHGSLDTPQKQLLLLWSKAAHGFSYEAVIGASANELVAGVRQCYPTRSEAEARFNEVVGKARDHLLGCYDSTTGKRLNIFPHTQIVQAAHHIEPDTIRG